MSAKIDALSPAAAAIVASIRERQATDPRLAVSRKDAQQMLGIGQSRQIALEESGVLGSYLEGSQRRITVSSIYEYLVERAIAAHPLGAAPAKARQPVRRYQPRRREPTPNEIRGLEIGNAKRAAEAKQRREARRTARV